MLEFSNPLPVIVEDGKDGYALYVTNGGSFENDIWCVVLCDGGHVRHYLSDQIKVYANATLSIKKNNMKDAIVEKVMQRYKQRSEVGIKKYGTTLEDNNSDNYFKHLMEELMDATLYLEKILDIVKNEPNDTVLGEKIRNMIRGKV
jgi:hypothetical protein